MVSLPACLCFHRNIGLRCFQCLALHLCVGTGVDLGRFNLHMTEEVPDIMKIDVCPKQMHCFGMTNHMRSNPLFAFLPRDLFHVLVQNISDTGSCQAFSLVVDK